MERKQYSDLITKDVGHFGLRPQTLFQCSAPGPMDPTGGLSSPKPPAMFPQPWRQIDTYANYKLVYKSKKPVCGA